jgi:hypothetical protein
MAYKAAGHAGKFGAVKQRAYLAWLRKGVSRAAAAAAVGISDECVRLHYHEDPTFHDRMELAEMDGHGKVESALHQLATRKHNVAAIIFYLKNRLPALWRDEIKLTRMTDEELNELFRAELAAYVASLDAGATSPGPDLQRIAGGGNGKIAIGDNG